jgi:hypothetical protein
MVSRVDAASALADLTEISSHVEAAAILDGEGGLVAATPGAEPLAAVAADLLREAGRIGGGRTPTRVDASLRGGSILVLREDGGTVVARTAARPPSALLFHDLATCLARLQEPAHA